MTARNLILVILDTLRADFQSLCERNNVPIASLKSLAMLAPLHPTARCGSFPTGPMRTDLLTGSLAFLRSGWAVPRLGEQTLLSRCKDAGFHSCLVTDNYVVVIPRVGGMLIDLFDTVDFVRGGAADPWTTPSAGLLQSCLESDWVIPTRSPRFEAQFLANAARLAHSRESHIAQVFQSATTQLRALQNHKRYVLWVDSFACHEPWLNPDETSPARTREPFFPAYVSRDRFPEAYLTKLRNAYVRRIGKTSEEMAEFVGAVEAAVKTGDTALIVLSDHGFLFGEFGFVGKAPDTPLPPELHEIPCWLSQHFAGHLPQTDLGVQPHSLHKSILSLLGLGHPTQQEEESAAVIFGRNSVRSDYLGAVDRDGLAILTRSSKGNLIRPVWVKREDLDPSIRLTSHRGIDPPAKTIAAVRQQIRPGMSDWLDGFVEMLRG